MFQWIVAVALALALISTVAQLVICYFIQYDNNMFFGRWLLGFTGLSVSIRLPCVTSNIYEELVSVYLLVVFTSNIYAKFVCVYLQYKFVITWLCFWHSLELEQSALVCTWLCFWLSF